MTVLIFLLTAIISGIIGIAIGVLIEEPLNQLKRKAILSSKRVGFKSKNPVVSPETFHFGGLLTSWIVVDGNGELEYIPSTIDCQYDPREQELPDELLELRISIKRKEKEKRQSGQPYLWDGPTYRLERFVISRTDYEENLTLQLCFGPSTYFTFLATNMSLDVNSSLVDDKSQTLREKYIQEVDWSKPVKFFSNSFGVDLAVVTSDEYLLIGQRSGIVGSRPGCFNISANEGLSRLLDRSEQSDAPDLYRCAIRGAAEELGIGLRRSDILFLSFGVDTQYSQWGILGLARTEQKFGEILQWRGAGVKDKWENTKLHAVPFDPNSVVQFVFNHSPWAPAALACVYHALVHEFSRSKVENAISKYSKIQVPKRLPDN